MHTIVFGLLSAEVRNYKDLLIALWPSLNWRHAGFGAVQAYVREGEERELRVHLWHPALVKAGIEESGLCHDHRFNMRSSVLVGTIIQTDFLVERDDERGPWETYEVVHARAAMEKGGSFHAAPTRTGERFRREATKYRVPEGCGYRFPKFEFHETRAEGLTITLVEKTAQENRRARILAPVGKPIVHAFIDTKRPEDFAPILAEGLAALQAPDR
jgi:hypothetical protein